MNEVERSRFFLLVCSHELSSKSITGAYLIAIRTSAPHLPAPLGEGSCYCWFNMAVNPFDTDRPMVSSMFAGELLLFAATALTVLVNVSSLESLREMI